jgi:hypothetical protein
VCAYLLVLVDGQTGAGDGELDDEHHEEDDHILSSTVKEQHSNTHTQHRAVVVLNPVRHTSEGGGSLF